MTNQEAYKVVAKHTFVAYRMHQAEFRPVIVFANNLEDAECKAKEYFGLSTIRVYAVKGTSDPVVYDI